jgi:hypothetical protein
MNINVRLAGIQAGTGADNHLMYSMLVRNRVAEHCGVTTLDRLPGSTIGHRSGSARVDRQKGIAGTLRA